MSANINLNDTFRGVQLRNLRPLLAEWLQGVRSFRQISNVKKVDLDECTITGLVEECYLAGFMDFQPAEYTRPGRENKFLDLTGEGVGIASGTATKRTDKKVAQEHLDRLLERCRANNANELAPVEISEIWVFGSMLDDTKVDVGDIDLVVLARRKSPFRGTSIIAHIDTHFPNLLPATRESLFFNADTAFAQKAIYGSRRHPIFSPSSLDTLVELHVPCAKVFDIEAGGAIPPVKLASHPLSKERADSIYPRASLPTFPVPHSPFTFTPAELAAGRLTDSMWGAHYFDMLTAEEANTRLDGRVLRGLELAPDATVFIPPRQNKAVAAIILERRFSVADRGDEHERWNINAQLSLRGNSAAFGPGWLDPVKKVIGRTIGADMTRLMGHRYEETSTADISVKLSLAKNSKEGRSLLKGIGDFIGHRVFSPYFGAATKHLKYGVSLIGPDVDYEFDTIFGMDDLQFEELGPDLNIDLDQVRDSFRYQMYWRDAFVI